MEEILEGAGQARMKFHYMSIPPNRTLFRKNDIINYQNIVKIDKPDISNCKCSGRVNTFYKINSNIYIPTNRADKIL